MEDTTLTVPVYAELPGGVLALAPLPLVILSQCLARDDNYGPGGQTVIGLSPTLNSSADPLTALAHKPPSKRKLS
jgi:hypothetical protein